jgi:CDGSH-type Zn-finger protein
VSEVERSSGAEGSPGSHVEGDAGGHVCPPACQVTPYTDGPYLLRGTFRITDEKGNEIAFRRKTVALCRCGRSQIKPWCDGTHKLIRFQAASAPRDPVPGSAQ